MKPDDIISYIELVAEEKVNLQKGMNFGIGKKYSVFWSGRRGDPFTLEPSRARSVLLTGRRCPRHRDPVVAAL